MHIKIIIVLVSLYLFISSPIHALEQCNATNKIQTADSFSSINDHIKTIGTKYGSDNVLLVFDIDNTLITMTQDLGSDQWFEWQNELLANEPNSKDLMVKDFNELIEAQSLLWQLIKMKPTEDIIPGIIESLQSDGYTTLLLTSRGSENYNQTLKSLNNNGLYFKTSALLASANEHKDHLPYNRDLITDIGITEQHAVAVGLGFNTKDKCINARYGFKSPCFRKPRRSLYSNGIFLTAGQHKGIMLQSILSRTRHLNHNRFRAIIYVDDKKRHVDNVFNTLCISPTDLYVFHYTHEQSRVDTFNSSNKNDIHHKWQEVNKLLHFLSN